MLSLIKILFMKIKFRKKLIINLLFVIFVIPLCVEIAVRLFSVYKLNDPALLFYGFDFGVVKQANSKPIRSLHPRLKREGFFAYPPGPLKMYVEAEGSYFPYETKINSDGFRTHEFTTRKDDKEIRIVCLGESSTFGFLLKDEDTYAYQLEKSLLNKLNRPVKVYNLGISESVTLWQESILRLAIEKLDPDIITFYGLHNDFRELLKLSSKERGDRVGLESSGMRFFLTLDLIVEGARKFKERKWRNSYLFDATDTALIDQSLKELISIAGDRKFYFIKQVIYDSNTEKGQAFSYEKYYLTLLEKKNDLGQNWSFPDKIVINHFPYVEKFSKENAEIVIDPRSLIRESHFLTHVHPSSIGATEIAKAIESKLLREMAKKGKRFNETD